MQNLTVLSMYLFIYLFLFLRIYSKSMVIIVNEARRQQFRKKVEQKKITADNSPDLFDTEVRPLVVKQSFSVQSGAKKKSKSSDTTKW